MISDDTYLFVTNMSFCYLEVRFFSLYDNFQMKYLDTLHGMDETTTTLRTSYHVIQVSKT